MAFDGLELLPEQAARYQDIRPLGRGGMGETWRARDLKFGRDVVLKTLRADRSEDEPLRRRFEREVRALARVNHPNVVRILDCFDAPCGLVYVMDYVGGDSLRGSFTGRSLTADDVLRLVAGVADGLFAVHGTGLLHRDLKPDNVMVDGSGTPVVIDFGLVGCLQGMGDGAQFERITRTGQVMGTLGYLPPETLWGRPHDERSDVFQVGVMLYEGLTGRLPYDSTAFVGVAAGRPVRPASPPSLHRAGLSADLDRLALAAVALEPDGRPPSASVLARACRALADGESLPIEAVPPEPLRTRPLAAEPVQAARRSRQGAAPRRQLGFVASMSQRVALKARAWWVLPAWARVVSGGLTAVLLCILGSSILAHLGYEISFAAPWQRRGYVDDPGPPSPVRVVGTPVAPPSALQRDVSPADPSSPSSAPAVLPMAASRPGGTSSSGARSIFDPEPGSPPRDSPTAGGRVDRGPPAGFGSWREALPERLIGRAYVTPPRTVVEFLRRATAEHLVSLRGQIRQGLEGAVVRSIELVEVGLRSPGLVDPPGEPVEAEAMRTALEADRIARGLLASGGRFPADPGLLAFQELRQRHALGACVPGGPRDTADLEAACGVVVSYGEADVVSLSLAPGGGRQEGLAVLTGSLDGLEGDEAGLIADVVRRRGHDSAARGSVEVHPSPAVLLSFRDSEPRAFRFRIRGADPRLMVNVWFGTAFVGRIHFPMNRESFVSLGSRGRALATVELLVMPWLFEHLRREGAPIKVVVSPVAAGLGAPAVVVVDQVELVEGGR